MDINLNVNISAPELCASINNLAASLVMQKTAIVTSATDVPADKSNFTFKLADSAATGEPSGKVENTTANKPETTEPIKENPAQDTGDDKPATEEPPKEEVQKVELEVVRGILKGKVEAGKKDKVAAFLASYDVKKLTDIPADKFTTEMQAKAEAL